MKKLTQLALMSAIALTGALGFNSCSSGDDAIVDNPNYNPETNEVNTQFVFNVAMGSTNVTRQSEDATQASSSLTSGKFRGIDDAHIMCFRQDGNDGKHVKSPMTAAKDFDMARVVSPGNLSADLSRRVLEMSLPLNSNSIVFYGRATAGDNYNEYGHLDAYTVSDNLNNVEFKLGRRLQASQKTEFQNTEKLLAAILTSVINVNRGTSAIEASATPGEGIPAYGFALPADLQPNLSWAGLVSTDGKSKVDPNVAVTQLEQKLINVYKQMTTIQTAELRNGSGVAVKRMIQDLWSIVNSVRCATPTSQPEAFAKYMAQLINIELTKYFTTASIPTTGAPVSGVEFKDVGSLYQELSTDSYFPTGITKPTSASNPITTYTNLANFPESYNLPDGATHLLFGDGAFSYAENFNSSAVGGGTFTVDDYYYPAELLYFGNSSIYVSDNDHVVNDYPSNVTGWNTAWTAEWKNTHVQSTTRSVAMKNDINYGTALLNTTIGYKSGLTQLEDNNKFIQKRDNNIDETNKKINITAESFKLRGILIGGQWPRVGWNYLRLEGSSEHAGYIYDVDIQNNGAIPASGQSQPTYTMCFDNYTAANTGQEKVYVALELENNTGVDFFGKDNLIPNGCRFYLIGELDPTGKTITWPTYHALPPYDTDGNTIQAPRVFIQDYMTSANFTIGQYSLQYAYLTAPDLRSSSVTLGLSVDLKWSTGITFNDVVLGGDTQTPFE